MLFAAFAALLALVACDRFQEFTFVQLSDTQIGFIDDSPQFTHSDSLMKAAVDAVNALDPALVVITGDLVNEPYNPVQDSVYRVRKAELQPPVYEVPGNHDILPYSEENHAHYLELRGYDRFCFREKGCAFIGQATSPCAMLVIGSVLASVPFKEIFTEWRAIPFVLLRLVGLGALTALLLSFPDVDPVLKGVLILMASMPAATNSTMLCTIYGGNRTLSAKLIFLSTALSIVTIPLWAIVLQRLL